MEFVIVLMSVTMSDVQLVLFVPQVIIDQNVSASVDTLD